jgi:hypothetical protein
MSAGDTINLGILPFLVSLRPIELFPRTAETMAAHDRAAAVRWGGTSYWPCQMVEYAPVFYVPAALGCWRARHSGFRRCTRCFSGAA